MIKKFFRDHPVHKKIVPIFDRLFLLRPTLFFPVWVMLTVGMAAARMNIDRYQIWIVSFDFKTIFLFIGMTLISGSTFILNQIKDVKSDSLNKKLFLVGDIISADQARKLMIWFGAAGLIALILSGWTALIFGLLLYLFWGILYNQEPFHFKKKPILGMLTNTLAGLIIYASGWMQVYLSTDAGLTEAFSLKMLLVAIPYLLCYTATSLLTTIPDLKGDEETGAKTFPVQFGPWTTILIGTFFVLAAFFLGYKLSDPVSSTAALVSLPFYAVALIRNQTKDVLRAIRYSILILAVFVMSIYPLLFPAVFIVFYLSKYYYWHRFDLHYPTFLVDND
ncbi:MAG: UbiA family prenyltransferase [FCB group bacterium]|nr:UbiA family prenyltransferase [FCB group bacterium]